MSDSFPSPTMPASSRSEVFVSYLDYFRARIIDKVGQLGDNSQRRSRLRSGWTPLELVKHLRFVELRRLKWGFAGRQVDDPWGDHRDGRWYVSPDETADQLLVKALAPDGADHAFADSIGPRGANGALQDPDAVDSKHLVEGHCELGVAVANQELDPTRMVGEIHGDVAGLLGHPVGNGVRGDPGDPHEARVVIDEHKDVEPLQQHRVDMEEVTRHQPLPL